MAWAQQESLQRKISMQILMLHGMHWGLDMGYHQKMWFCMVKVLVQFQLLIWRLGKHSFAKTRVYSLINVIPLHLGMKLALLFYILP